MSEKREATLRVGTNSDGRLKFLCPFHDERTPSCNVDVRRGRWRCFGCGEGGLVEVTVKLKREVKE